jgi:hypothetical protein
MIRSTVVVAPESSVRVSSLNVNTSLISVFVMLLHLRGHQYDSPSRAAGDNHCNACHDYDGPNYEARMVRNELSAGCAEVQDQHAGALDSIKGYACHVLSLAGAVTDEMPP